jgi:CheY-like chemotaxis protein
MDDFTTLDVLWFEDDEDDKFIDSLHYNLKPDLEDLSIRFHIHPYKDKKSFDNENGGELSGLRMGLILIDFNLPGGINGDEIIKEIRSYPNNDDIPIIFYSVYLDLPDLKGRLDKTYKQVKSVQRDGLQDEILKLCKNNSELTIPF